MLATWVIGAPVVHDRRPGNARPYWNLTFSTNTFGVRERYRQMADIRNSSRAELGKRLAAPDLARVVGGDQYKSTSPSVVDDGTWANYTTKVLPLYFVGPWSPVGWF